MKSKLAEILKYEGLIKTAGKSPDSRGRFKLFTSRQGRISDVSNEDFSLSEIQSFVREANRELDVMSDEDSDESEYIFDVLSSIFPIKVAQDHDLNIFDITNGDGFYLQDYDSWEYEGQMDPEEYKRGSRIP